MKALIVTRFSNEILYNRMISTNKTSFECVKAENFHGRNGSVDYLFYCFSFFNDYDFIINVDEDAFFTNNEEFELLLNYMNDQKIDVCGIPDGGQCIHRFHNPLTMNPFFNIFSKEFCKKASLNKQDVYNSIMTDDLKQKTPKLKNDQFRYDDFEPFYKVFFWAHKNNLKFLYLDSYEFVDEVSTIIKNHLKNDFIVHTWYAREYQQQKKRIDDCFSFFQPLNK